MASPKSCPDWALLGGPLGQSSAFTHKYQTNLNNFGKAKRYCLFCHSVRNKLECKSLVGFSSLVDCCWSLPQSGVPESVLHLIGFDLTSKHQTRLERQTLQLIYISLFLLANRQDYLSQGGLFSLIQYFNRSLHYRGAQILQLYTLRPYPHLIGLVQCYKTYYGRNLRSFIISQRVCRGQAYPVWSNVCGQRKEPTLEWSN